MLEVNLIPWQRWLLIHALELLEDGTFRFRTVVVLIARQNGKSTLAQILALFFMYVRVNGKKALELRSGERYKVQAANRRGGRGLSGDLVIMDELREHQSWDSWSAVTKTTLARMLAQIWALSNAGDVASIVLAHLRRMAHASLGDPDGINRDLPTVVEIEVPADLEDVPDDSLGIFEWSAAPGCAIEDRDGWANANPSLGYTITERAIASAMRTDPEWVFRTEVLCQWSAGTLEGPFPPGKWDDCLDTDSSIATANVLGVGVDVSADRSMTHIALAGYNQAGRIHVEIVASRYGTEWVTDYLTAGADVRNFCGIALQARSAPCSPLVDELAAADLPVLEWQGPDMTAGTGKFYDLVRNSELVHLQQQVLDVAAATAVTKPAGDAWLWNRKQSPTDIAPLVAATAAVWALLNKPVEVVSAYEESELTIA